MRFTPTMDVDGWKQTAARGEGRKEGRKGWRSEEVGMENRDLTPWPSHGCDILPYLVPCSPTLVEFTWKGNPSFLYLLTRVVRVLVTRREHWRATTSPRCLSCSPGIPDSCKSSRHRVNRITSAATKLSRFVRLSSSVGSYEKMLLGCIGRMEESRNELIRNSVYRSNLFVPGTMDVRERLEEEKRFSGSSFSSRKNNFQFTFDSKYLKNNS